MDTTTATTLAKIFKAGGVPFKNIEAYGSQVVVTCKSRAAADKVARLLKLGSFKVRGVIECRDYNQKNKGTCLRPTTHKVWRTYACV